MTITDYEKILLEAYKLDALVSEMRHAYVATRTDLTLRNDLDDISQDTHALLKYLEDIKPSGCKGV